VLPYIDKSLKVSTMNRGIKTPYTLSQNLGCCLQIDKYYMNKLLNSSLTLRLFHQIKEGLI
jgi:hypothetical protein